MKTPPPLTVASPEDAPFVYVLQGWDDLDRWALDNHPLWRMCVERTRFLKTPDPFLVIRFIAGSLLRENIDLQARLYGLLDSNFIPPIVLKEDPETIHEYRLQRLANHLTWIIPIGNDDSYVDGKTNAPIPALRGYAVAKRSVNNVDHKNTRVDYLRRDETVPYRWKKPFREAEHLFPTYLEALEAAEKGLFPSPPPQVS